MATLLAKKSGAEDNAIATDDEHHEALASDPTVSAFPQGSAFGASNATNTSSTFGGPAAFGTPSTGGFGSSSSFGTPTSNGFGSSSATGGSSFGSSPMGAGQPGQVTQQQNLTAGAEAAVKGGADTLVENTNTDWINKKWRPMMGWMYMATCTADFVVFPVLWSILQALSKGNVTSQWQPLTLQGAGLYHVAMGAVLGIAAYGRTKEKIEGAAK
jgi:hypothetical protein